MLRLALLACAAGQYAIDDIVHAPPSALEMMAGAAAMASASAEVEATA